LARDCQQKERLQSEVLELQRELTKQEAMIGRLIQEREGLYNVLERQRTAQPNQ
jgi:hypothetical protein